MNKIRNIEAVLFDLGNTLVSYYKSGEFFPILRKSVEAVAEIYRRSGAKAVDDDESFTIAKTLNRERSDGRVRPLSERLVEIFGAPPQEVSPQFEHETAAAFLGPIFSMATVSPRAVNVLDSVRGMGIKTAIVSNTPWGSPAAPWRAELKRLGLLNRVDAVVFCVDVGWRKPAPQPFERALELLKVSPERAVFLGDDVRWDVAGARQSGIKPILVSPDGAIVEDCAVIRSLDELPALLATS